VPPHKSRRYGYLKSLIQLLQHPFEKATAGGGKIPATAAWIALLIQDDVEVGRWIA
jgi:hypothetical protein